MRRLVGTFQTDYGHCATVIASALDASHPAILAMAYRSAPNQDPTEVGSITLI
jgi:hypothetical protein